MKLKFDANQDYQKEVLKAINSLFKDCELGTTKWGQSVSIKDFKQGFDFEDEVKDFSGGANYLHSPKHIIYNNLCTLQKAQDLPMDEELKDLSFDIEMETGTGKTYVYLRSIFEMHKNYGLSKFVIVVPSVAIREGVQSSWKAMQPHFRLLYEDVANFIVYDSSKIDELRSDFSENSELCIMVINTAAFAEAIKEGGEKRLRMHKEHERYAGGLRPVDLIAHTRPVIIIDEPQSASGKATKKSLESFKPLMYFNYSATHKEHHHLIYRLSAIEALEKDLVKKIYVEGVVDENSHNSALCRLLKIALEKDKLVATLELEVRMKDGEIKRKSVKAGVGTDLEKLTKNTLYEGMIISEINSVKEQISFLAKENPLKLGESLNDINADLLKKEVIKRAIYNTLDKENKLLKNYKGLNSIKVLCLFFIDRVVKYNGEKIEEKNDSSRSASDPKTRTGVYAKIFEDELVNALLSKEYEALLVRILTNLDLSNTSLASFASRLIISGVSESEQNKEKEENEAKMRQRLAKMDVKDLAKLLKEVAPQLHGGYFSCDNKGRPKDTSGVSKDDKDSYELIMRDKERLLSLKTPLRFIFSHSALREGWDNPNVFTICTLNESHSEIKRRQELGRGLRLCVNQKGERVRTPGVNELVVVANESYADFANALQKELVEDGYDLGLLSATRLAKLKLSLGTLRELFNGQDELLSVGAAARINELDDELAGKDDEYEVSLGITLANTLQARLKKQGLVGKKGELTPKLRSFTQEGELPHSLTPFGVCFKKDFLLA